MIASNNLQIWHQRLGYLNYDSLKKMARNSTVNGLPKNPPNGTPCFCDDCAVNKLSQHPFYDRKNRATGTLDLVHTDICGPFCMNTHSGKRYLLTFIDDYSRKTFIYCLVVKNETLGKFKEFKASIENEMGCHIYKL